MLTGNMTDALSGFRQTECYQSETIIQSITGVIQHVSKWADNWVPKRILFAFNAGQIRDRVAERFNMSDLKA